nr:adrenodoxin, mitochondrial isoform X1 [Peromyscus maniculatus bairdii]
MSMSGVLSAQCSTQIRLLQRTSGHRDPCRLFDSRIDSLITEAFTCIISPYFIDNPVKRIGSSEDKITVYFKNRDGETLKTTGKVGDSLLDVVIENNLDIDGFGACEGTLACSTCHLIFEDHIYEKLDAITDEENDMLDLAYGLTARSRLGCQVCLTKAMDNMTVSVPEAVADVRQSVDMSKNS